MAKKSENQVLKQQIKNKYISLESKRNEKQKLVPLCPYSVGLGVAPGVSGSGGQVGQAARLARCF